MATVIPINSFRKSRLTLHDHLAASYRKKYHPKDRLEAQLVEQLAHSHWRLMIYQSMGPEPPDDSPDSAIALFPRAA